MTVSELYAYLDRNIPASLSCDWDNDGLSCCADSHRTVRRVLIALDPTEEMVERAIAGQFDVLLTHHPLVFFPLRGVTDQVPASRKIVRLLSYGIAAMSFHTRLDGLAGGVNDVLADKLSLSDAEPFGPEGERFGRIGYVTPTDLTSFCRRVKYVLGAPFVLAAGNRPVSRVAVLGGDGKDYVASARACGADTFVSGRFSYDFMAEAPENGLNLVEAGHFYTEHPVCEVLADLVHEADSTVETVIVSSQLLQTI